MKWRKLGRVFCPEKTAPWMQSHAANPVGEILDGDTIRVYFSTRDEQNRSSITTLEFSLSNPQKIVRLSDAPLLTPGKPGLFDDSGVSMGCLEFRNNETYLYFLGWNLGVTVPWRNAIGLAKKEGHEFTRVSEAPVFDRNHDDPYSISYPWVLKNGQKWMMWYGSNLSWGARQSDMAHLIKYAESTDGLNWKSKGIAIPFKDDNEYAMSKPCVIKDTDCYRMWYSCRGDRYRIGYAESLDGRNWTRKDEEVGIDVSDESWECREVSYPFVFDHNGSRYMLYNGNRYGLTGFGLAVLEHT